MGLGLFSLPFVAIFAFFMQVNPISYVMYVYPVEVSAVLKGDSMKQKFQTGTAQENEKASDASSAAGVIITLQNIAISPASERVVRLVSVMPFEKGKTWRAYFERVNRDNFIAQQGDLKTFVATTSNDGNVVWRRLLKLLLKRLRKALRTHPERSCQIINNGNF